MSDSDWFTARVTEKWREAEGIYAFELRAEDSGPLPPFEAGAHVDLRIGDSIRQYSLCNDPREHGRYVIAIQRESHGRGGSREACDSFGVGTLVSLRGPRNLFHLADDTGYAVLLAGGIGVTPILAMAEHLCSSGVPFELHFFTRSHERTPFLERLSGSRYRHAVNLHLNLDPLDTASLLQTLIDAPKVGRHVYACGPGGFVEAVLSAAKGAEWTAERVHVERFSSTSVARVGEDRDFVVEIRSTGTLVSVPAGTTVVAALSRAGISLATSCSEGFCGTCVTKVLAGVPDHRDIVLDAEERARNNLFTPCCSRALSDLLVLDL
jgi:vanillate monooxygenase ferredoxin subunit